MGGTTKKESGATYLFVMLAVVQRETLPSARHHSTMSRDAV
jgi:hypothetical protein